MSLHIMDKLRAIAGVLLEIFPIPDGDVRETLLDIANPCRPQLKEIVRKSDAEDERHGLRKAFKAFDTQHVPDDKAAHLIGRVLDPTDIDTVTATHDHTISALTKLRDDLNGNGGTSDDEPPDDEKRYAFSNSGGETLELSDDEISAVEAFLAERRKAVETEGTKTEASKAKSATKTTSK